MRGIHFMLAAVVLVATVGTVQAGDSETFLYFATHDPFSGP